MFHTAFQILGKVSKAIIYATALGFYELNLNGRRVGDALFTPDWTSYTSRLQYQTYSVAELLKDGGNALGMMVADGWHKGNLGWKQQRNCFGSERAALLQLHIVYEDGNEEQNFHLTTGFVGTPYLCHVLSQNGQHEAALRLILQESYPSWLYSVTQGATTMWEHWDGVKADGSFWSDDMNSFNHYAYGAIGDWLYQVVASLDTDHEQAGYKHIRIQPRTGQGFDYGKASLESMYGEIRSGWERTDNGGWIVSMTIPANTTAEVHLPDARLEALLESGQSIFEADGIYTRKQTSDGITLTLGSGSYQFTSVQ